MEELLLLLDGFSVYFHTVSNMVSFGFFNTIRQRFLYFFLLVCQRGASKMLELSDNNRPQGKLRSTHVILRNLLIFNLLLYMSILGLCGASWARP